MLLNKEQLTQSLLQLVQGDYDLLNDIMNEYVEASENKRFDELESYGNSNLNEIIECYRVCRFTDIALQAHQDRLY